MESIGSIAARVLQDCERAIAEKGSRTPKVPGEIYAGGSIAGPAQRVGAVIPTDRPQPSETIASQFTVRSSRNARWIVKCAAAAHGGGAALVLVGRTSPLRLAAANDNAHFATTVLDRTKMPFSAQKVRMPPSVRPIIVAMCDAE